jgi:CRISPR system Cascade subunit CasD
MSKYVLMDLNAPLQSWGEYSRHSNRTTLDRPTKSGIIGIICCAMGIQMDTEAERVQELSSAIKMSSFTLARGKSLEDFQSIGTHYDKKDPLEKRYLLRKNGGSIADCPTKIFSKFYLSEYRFLVLLEVESEELANKIQEALLSPEWPLYLGRKNCIPATPIPCKEGVLDSESQVLEAIKSRAPGVSGVTRHSESPSGMPFLEEPLGERKFGTRLVAEEYLVL